MTTMNVIDKIKHQLSSNSVVLYMKGTPDFPQCGFSGRTVQLLDACNAKYATVNIFDDPELREALKEYSHWPTYPQLYVKGELIGGCDIVIDLFEKGELANLLVGTPSLPADE
ncbi:MAG: Grx4 family monothiol glutaredoxin [Methylovulum sp.]|nr:Grx4 family monothiol glutaredoxin [Methylovulum sp.]